MTDFHASGLPGESAVLSRTKAALRLVCASLPFLSEIAAMVRVQVDRRVPTAGVFASGRILINDSFVAALSVGDLVFVLAHELLHLALRTHARGEGEDTALVNLAHDLIINDILSHRLQREPPAGAPQWDGARHSSLEALVAMLRSQGWCSRDSWARPQQDNASRTNTAMGRALMDAGLLDQEPRSGESIRDHVEHDALPESLERELFPDDDPSALDGSRRAIEEAAARALSLAESIESMDQGCGTDPGQGSAVFDALRSLYRPPWELALQRWLDAMAPGQRTFARPSRRAGTRTDVVLPGRRREAWTMHIVLDSSGSMDSWFRDVLGMIVAFCENAGVAQVRILQCDTEVTIDEFVDCAALQKYTVRGLGGSDMSAAMLRLAMEPEVEAAVIVTDGIIAYPPAAMPYQVLWAVPEGFLFEPPYGTVVSFPSTPA